MFKAACITFCFAILLTCAPALAATRYVNVNLTTGANNGTTWADAYRSADAIPIALAASVSGDEVWVAAGTYRPTLTTTRTIFINLRTGIAIYGGFAGTESTLNQRDFTTNLTILSGDLAGNDPVVTDNSFHIINGNGANATAILDGFTITAGNANGSSANDTDRGGGLIFLNSSNATIRNCRITSNRCSFGGGGTYIRSASPTFVDCTWQGNTGGSFGGAIDMFTNCNPTFTRCAFISNTATRAGGVEVFGTCQPTFTNCIFRNNTAGSSGGGGLYIASSSTVNLRNCTIARNTTTGSGSGILTSSSTTRLFNTIVYNNTGAGGTTANQLSGATTQATYSCVEGGFTGMGNVSGSPLFVDLNAGNLRISAFSPCIDAGSNANAGSGNTTDFAGAPRFVDDPGTTDTGVGPAPIVDIGAYEYQPAGLTCDGIDFNNDQSFFDPQDVDAFFSIFSEGPCIPATATCADIDINNDGSLFDPCDVASFLVLFSEGPCTLCGL